MKKLILVHNQMTGAIELRLDDDVIPVRVESFSIEDDEHNNSILHLQIRTFPQHTLFFKEEV